MAIAAEKKDEKVEKRRALGRGLESLLPGPRVVTPSSPGTAFKSSGDGGETKVPRFARDDNRGARDNKSVGERDGNGSAVMASQEIEAAAILAAGQPGAAVPALEQREVIPIQGQALPGNQVVNLDIGLIDKNPYQTRYVFDEDMLIELKESIKQHGVVQPVVVRPAEEEGRYILVLGERRLRASKMAGKDTIPALVRRVSPQQAAEMTVLENVVREDLNPLEQAEAFRLLSQQFNLTQAQIAERVGVSRETISNYMRLLKLPKKVMGYMLEDRLTFSDARLILGLENPDHIEALADEVVAKHMKWDEIEDRVRRINGDFPLMPGQSGPNQPRAARWMDPNVRAAQTDMERILGMRVRIRDRNGKGKISIEYGSVDEYERVVELLGSKK